MEHIAELEQLIRQYAPQVVLYGLMGLGALVVLAGAYVTATPSPDDDVWYNKLLDKPITGHHPRSLVILKKEKKKDGVLGISNKPEKKEDA